MEGALLDVGCGPGRLTRRIAERRPGVRVTGLDPSADMIRQARRSPAPANLAFREGTPATAGFVEAFDMAVSVLSFHHWEEPAEELFAVHRALKPGGVLWIYEQDAKASAAELHADRAPLFGFLRVPAAYRGGSPAAMGSRAPRSRRPCARSRTDTASHARGRSHGPTFRIELTRPASSSVGH